MMPLQDDAPIGDTNLVLKMKKSCASNSFVRASAS